MSISCNDVCDEIIRRLVDLGFEIPDDENHEPIISALADVILVRQEPEDCSCFRIETE